jgi:hypothetical protein
MRRIGRGRSTQYQFDRNRLCYRTSKGPLGDLLPLSGAEPVPCNLEHGIIRVLTEMCQIIISLSFQYQAAFWQLNLK